MYPLVEALQSPHNSIRQLIEDEEAVSRKVQAALGGTGHSQLRTIRCTFHEGIATLTGEVRFYFLKQLAQECAQRVNEVDLVDNRIQVSTREKKGDPLGPCDR